MQDKTSDILVVQAEKTLSETRIMNKDDGSLQALISADQALETFLRAYCVRLGCSDETTLSLSKSKEKSFDDWGMTEYIIWLGEKGVINKEEKTDFFTIHKWRNQVQNCGLIPSTAQTLKVIESISEYIEKQKKLWKHEVEYPALSTIDKSTISEESDVHPIFRMNPFLIEEGLKLIRGEKRLIEDALKHIDIYFTDKNGTDTFVEVEWNSIHPDQTRQYLEALKKRGTAFRLVWCVPSNLEAHIPHEIEVISFDKTQIEELVRIRREARRIIEKILEVLSKPVTPAASMMYQLEYQFPSIISACYFSGEAKTENKTVAVGLRKQSIGRYLDIIRSICQSNYSVEMPELTLLLVGETLNAPYYIEIRGGVGKVEHNGFYGHVHAKRSDSKYKLIAEAVEPVNALVKEFGERNLGSIKAIYGESPSRIDLLYRVLLSMPAENIELGDRIVVKRLIEYFLRSLSLTQTKPLASIRHSLLNIEIRNEVSPTGYETDMAKRVVEICGLKRALQCISGVPIIRVLKEEYFREKMVINRVPCQHFRLEKHEKYLKNYVKGET